MLCCNTKYIIFITKLLSSENEHQQSQYKKIFESIEDVMNFFWLFVQNKSKCLQRGNHLREIQSTTVYSRVANSRNKRKNSNRDIAVVMAVAAATEYEARQHNPLFPYTRGLNLFTVRKKDIKSPATFWLNNIVISAFASPCIRMSIVHTVLS